jgi:23S rRNA (adenine2503-C2)-methyltransferase
LSAHDQPPSLTQLPLLGTTRAALRAAAAGWFGAAKGAGVSDQVHQMATRQGRFAPDSLGLGPRAAALWRRHAALRMPTVTSEQREAGEHGEVLKRALRLADGRVVESVSLPMGRGRRSLCVSTQVGCARACTFCETGKLGLVRNLTAEEIVAQVVLDGQRGGGPPDTVVFQGMGEPLDNLDGLLPALAVLTDGGGAAFAQDKLTVCTVGHVPGIDALREQGFKRLNLSLSLNHADAARRAVLMPRSTRYSLAELQQALLRFRRRANTPLGVHWCLLPGINDDEQDAARLAAFVAPLGRTLVHLIPYNPGTSPIAPAPEEHEVDRFAALLRARGVAVRRRVTKGRSVMAGCGQLGGADDGAAKASAAPSRATSPRPARPGTPGSSWAGSGRSGGCRSRAPKGSGTGTCRPASSAAGPPSSPRSRG